MAVHDGSLFEETYNLLNAWLSVVPGNGAHNLRRLALLETNVADLSFLFTLDHGDAVSPHLGKEALAVFETPHRTPYAFNLHVQDVGHTLVLGATGSGKSFALNFLITHAQKYAPQTVVLDIGHSYRKLATLLGGRYLELGLRHHGVTINPFALDPTPEHLHFLHAFVRVLLEGDDAATFDSDAGSAQFSEAIAHNEEIILHYLSAAETRRYWRLSIADPGNPDGYIEIGELYLGSYLELSKTYDEGFSEKTAFLLDRNRTPYGVGEDRFYNAQLTFNINFGLIEPAEFRAIRQVRTAGR